MWDYLHLGLVKKTVDAFIEKYHNRDSHWFGMEPGTYIQGFHARNDD